MVPTASGHVGLCQMEEARRVVMATEWKQPTANPVSKPPKGLSGSLRSEQTLELEYPYQLPFSLYIVFLDLLVTSQNHFIGSPDGRTPVVVEVRGCSLLTLEFPILPWEMASPTSRLCSLCLQGTTWTSPFRRCRQSPQKSCGWPNTDTEEVSCTHISTTSSPR